jgi:hypothetical protein
VAALIVDTDAVRRALEGIDRSRGVIIATAHLGALLAGPVMLGLTGLPAK